MVNRRKVFVQQFSDLLRSGRRTGVERLELSDNGNLVTICFEGGGRREVNVEGDSEAALILDVIRRVLYYPLIYYQSVQQHIPGAANITTAAADGGTLTKYRREHAEATFSFTACSFNRQGKDGPISGDDEALELADRAQGFFLFAGRQLLADLGVVVVRVENTQSRSAFDTDETDRRYGFDVLFRYEREDKRAVPAISKPPITFTKEE